MAKSGLTAVKTKTGVFLSWRLLRHEVYGAERTRLHAADFIVYKNGVRLAAVTDSTNYVDPAGTCCNCLVADGCTIEGSVENSVLFRGVSVARGASVKNSILMQDVTIHRDVVLHHVIADKNVEIMDERTLMGHEQYPLSIAKGSKI